MWSSSTVTTDAPKWVITTSGTISPESLKRLVEEADEAMKSGSVIVLPEGMMLHRVGDTNYLTPVESTVSVTDEPRWLIALAIVLTLLAACCAVAAIALAYIAITGG